VIFREFTPVFRPFTGTRVVRSRMRRPEPAAADQRTLAFTGGLSKNDPTSGTKTAWPALTPEKPLPGCQGYSPQDHQGTAIQPNDCGV
jgi:hypothetical protein